MTTEKFFEAAKTLNVGVEDFGHLDEIPEFAVPAPDGAFEPEYLIAAGRPHLLCRDAEQAKMAARLLL